jgi:hypothetical protein
MRRLAAVRCSMDQNPTNSAPPDPDHATTSGRRVAGRPGRPVAGTPDWKPEFLAALADGLHVRDAAFRAKVEPGWPYRVRQTDEEFRKAWDAAQEIGTRMLEREAARRAYHGTLRPVFQGGVEVGQVREYSDSLMQFLLKARRPDKYRDNSRVEVTGADGGPVEVCLTLEDRRRREQEMLRAAQERLARRALPAANGAAGPGEN